MKYIKTYHIFEKAVPFADILKPETQQGLLITQKADNIKLILLYDFDDKKILAYAQLRKWSDKDNFWQIDSTAAEKDYGPDLYDLIMMSVYPEPVRPSSTIKPDAQNVWRFYDEKRSDVKKTRITEDDDDYEDAFEDDSHSGEKDDPIILNLVNTKFSLRPTSALTNLIKNGEEFLKTYNITKSKIFASGKKYFWKRYG